jgi:pimeloyl-ACP methyl ester carboxylesterase
MAAIMERLGIESAVHVGWSVGSQIVLELYRQYPARADALVMLFGPAGRALEHTRLPIPAAWIERIMAHPRADLATALLARIVGLPLAPGVMTLLRRARLIGLQTSERDLLQILQDMTRLDPQTVTRMTVSTQRHSAFDVLPLLRVPLLIMTARRDPFMPMATVAVPMHEAAPGSELIVLDAATHAALLDFPDEIAKHVDDFVARRVVF